MFPELRGAVERIAQERSDIHTVIPAVSHVSDKVVEATKDWPTPLTIVTGKVEKFEAFDAMDFALSTSGTVTTELALANLPTVVAYKLGKITGFIAERLVTIEDITLISIVEGKRVFPEFIQSKCTADNLAAAMISIMSDPEEQQRQKREMADALQKMGLGRESPSARAAETVLGLLA